MPKAYKKEKKVAYKREAKKTEVIVPDEDMLQSFLEQDYILKCQTLYKSAEDSRRRYDWEWLTRDLFRRGFQFSRYNPSNRTVILSTRQNVKIPINLVWSQMRAVRNQVVNFKPKWEVLPRGLSKEALNNARYSGRALDYYYDKLNLKSHGKKTVTQGLTYSVGGPWEIGTDPLLDNGNGDIYAWLLDTYDFYIDPFARTLEEAEYCIKAIRRPLSEIKSNPNYNFTEQIENGEAKLASSEYKAFLLQTMMYGPSVSDKQEDGLILKEVWMKERATDDNKEALAKELKKNDEEADDLRDGEVLMRVITYTDLLSRPLRMQLKRRSDYPFVLYEADIEPTTLYGESWIKHLIPANRVLNNLESSTFEYNYMYAKGRLAIQKNSGVRIVSNRHGGIVEYNAGTNPPVAIPLNPLQQSYQWQIENMRRYIEDLGGAHDVSLGRIPTGVKSGVGIAELKSADATNQQDLVDNYADFLTKVGKKILNEIAKNFDVPKLIKILGKGGDPEHFAVIGEKSGKKRKRKTEVKIGSDVFDLAIIGDESEVRVTIGSWLAYTKQAQQEKLKEFFESGLIDQKTFLKHAEFGDVDNIVEETRREELLNKFRGTPAQEGMPSDEEIAEQETIMMTNEGKMPDALPTDNHQVHLAIHQEGLGIQGNPLIEAHMAQHEKFISQGISDKSQLMSGAIQEAPQMPQQGGMEQMGQALPPATGIPMPGASQAPPSPEEQALISSLQGIL